MPEKKEEKGLNIGFWIILIIGIILSFLWLLFFTNLPGLILKTPVEIKNFQNTIFAFTLVISMLFVAGLIVWFFFSDRFQKLASQEGSSVILVEPHTQFDKIRKIALENYGQRLGDCVKTSSLKRYTELGVVPSTRFFLFENIGIGDRVESYSMWKQNYIRKIVTERLYKEINSRDTNYKFWTGEFRTEEYKTIGEAFAGKKKKNVKNIKTESETSSDGSATESEEEET